MSRTPFPNHQTRFPIASASLAQVHLATTHDGRRVAVKVQHADVEEISRLDLRILGHVLRLIQLIVRVRGLEEYHADISQLIAEELDFEGEARNIATIKGNFAADSGIGFLYQGLRIEFHLLASSQYYVIVTPNGGTPQEFNGSLAAGNIDRVLLENNNGSGGTQAVAISSRSSLAALPAMMDSARTRLGLPEEICGFFLPFASAMFRVGATLGLTTGAVFLGRLYGVPMGGSQLVTLVLTATVTSFSIPGIPGGSIIAMVPEARRLSPGITASMEAPVSAMARRSSGRTRCGTAKVT